MLGKDMKIEEQNAEKVQQFLDDEIIRLGELIEEYKANVKTMGEDFNMDNPNGGMYSGMELTEIHHEMEKQFQYSEEASRDIYFYKKLRNAPYFARVDFKGDNAPRERKLYIGLKTLQKHDTFEMLVCDWRAPIASLFYEDFEEKAFFEAPKGRISGDLLLKRQFKFENGKLKYYVDSDLKIDDDILREVLSSSSGEHLKVIVNSIQREQNKVIRYTENENLLVVGPAGSGKTSVGFHRLAYLLYQNRTELNSAEIIMFSNNDIFSSYVADIIPELGEMPINYASFYNIFAAEIPTVTTGDYYSLSESIINGDSRRSKSAEIKLSKDFAEYLEKMADVCEPEFSDITLFDDVIISKEALLDRFLSDTENTQKSRGERLAAYIQGVIDEYFINNRESIYLHIDGDSEVDEDTAKLFKVKRREVKQTASEMIKAATLVDPIAVYFKLLEQYSAQIHCPELLDTKATLEKGCLEFEDALGVVYVKGVLGTSAVLSGVKHILIDEAQDLSHIQHRIILKMFPRAKYTLLADTNQAIIPQLNTTVNEELAEIYNAKILNLNKSYRSTKEINGYALKLLPEEKRYEIFERSGEEVNELSGNTEEFVRAVAELAQKSPATCIITRNLKDAINVYNELKTHIDGLRICDNKSCELSHSPIVMPLALTKGLEFDNVVVYDKNRAFAGEENKKYLYMASTRALHRLTIFEVK